MSSIDLAKLFAHVQAVARFHGATVGRLPQIVELVRRSGKWKLEDVPEIERLLRKPGVRLTLQNKYEAGLFQASDGSWCLVSYALPASAAEARERMTHRPLDPQTQCAFCLLSSKHAIRDLRPDLDCRGNQPTPGLSFHRQCLTAWRALRILAAKDMNHV